MTEIIISGLEWRLQKQLEGAELAFVQGRYEQAIMAAGAVLAEQPACLPVRVFLRSAQVKHAAKAPHIFIRLKNIFLLQWVRRQLEHHPERAVAVADRVLQTEINQPAALSLLGRAATVLGWSATAIFAYECSRVDRPDEAELALAYGHALLVGRRAAEALHVAEAVLQTQPLQLAALHLRQQAALAVTLATGKWEAPGSYREKLRDQAPESPPTLR